MSIRIMPFLYLDLDGTVRYSKGGHRFIQGPADVAVYPDVVPKLKEYRRKGFKVCAITNQGGVAFGYKTEKDVWDEIHRMNYLLHVSDRYDLIDHFSICFAHEKGTVERYAYRSLCRKPEIGMLVEIERYYAGGLAIPDYSKSLLVGDRKEDRLCAERAGIAFQWAHEFFGRHKQQEQQ